MWRVFSGKVQARRVFLLLHFLWLLTIITSLTVNHFYSRHEIEEIAHTKTEELFKHDLAFLLWGISHGGVYVPMTEKTPPNPYLSAIPERDILTPSGRQLTLLDPANMVRQINNNYYDTRGIYGHITSLKPINPENAPDSWETQALKTFEQGNNKVCEFTTFNGTPYMRRMQPLVTKKSCLTCHAGQDYKEGDIRGGVSILLPMQTLLNGHEKVSKILFAGHLFIYLIGFIFLVFIQSFVAKRITERDQATTSLQNSEEKFRAVADYAYAWEY